MAWEMDFGLLGPLSVHCGPQAVPVRQSRQRVVLAALLLSAGRVVAVEGLADALWGPDLPPSARVSVQNHVRRLRQTLGDAGRARIRTRPPGYLIEVAAEELDVTRFETRLAAARAAARDSSWDTASARAREALDLWHGEPLADVESEFLVQREVPRLTELRMQAVQARIDAELNLGRHAGLVAELERLTVTYPLRESLYEALMLALYRGDRRAEALATYQKARRILVDEVGTEPGSGLQELHQRILTADPALAAPQAPLVMVPVPVPVPRQLPGAVSSFTGRDAELAALSGLLDPGPGPLPPATVISVIGGTAGVGKTALAVQWAHRLAARFPDGQLYVNLRGFDPGEPVDPADALAGFLRALGVAGAAIPDALEERARQYRSALAGRRMLVLLDNARDSDHARPLLPGDGSSVAVVTSRDALAGLVAADGAQRLDLDVLPQADAVALLRSLIGARAEADPEAAAALAGLCARLPLALRIAAELAVSRREVPLAELTRELRMDRLDSLDAGEDRADVRAVFSWSYGHLPADVAGALSLIGLHPGTDLDAYAVAALTGTTVGQARRILGQLHRASLLQSSGAGRYGMHDLLRAYAREQAAASDSGERCHQALTRLFDYYLAAEGAAAELLYPALADQMPPRAELAAVIPAMPDRESARAWLDRERENLIATVAYCAGRGWPRYAIDVTCVLFRYLEYSSHLPEAQTVGGYALDAARQSGDLRAEGSVLRGLCGISNLKGHFRDAARYGLAALELYRRCGDRWGQGAALDTLATTQYELHDYQTAASYLRESTAIFGDLGDSRGVARGESLLGAMELELGLHDQAAEHLWHALPLLRAVKDELAEATALEAIGLLVLRQGELSEATAMFGQALLIYRRFGHLTGMASQFINLGNVSVRRTEYRQAISYLQQALTMSREAGGQAEQAATLRALAEAQHAMGEPAAARACLAAALQLATETGNTYAQASTHCDIADSHHVTGEDERARHHWQRALVLYTWLGAPEAGEVQSRLSAIN